MMFDYAKYKVPMTRGLLRLFTGYGNHCEEVAGAVLSIMDDDLGNWQTRVVMSSSRKITDAQLKQMRSNLNSPGKTEWQCEPAIRLVLGKTVTAEWISGDFDVEQETEMRETSLLDVAAGCHRSEFRFYGEQDGAVKTLSLKGDSGFVSDEMRDLLRRCVLVCAYSIDLGRRLSEWQRRRMEDIFISISHIAEWMKNNCPDNRNESVCSSWLRRYSFISLYQLMTRGAFAFTQADCVYKMIDDDYLFRYHEGIRLGIPGGGAPTWHFVKCDTDDYHRAIGKWCQDGRWSFFLDGFIYIVVGQRFDYMPAVIRRECKEGDELPWNLTGMALPGNGEEPLSGGPDFDALSGKLAGKYGERFFFRHVPAEDGELCLWKGEADIKLEDDAEAGMEDESDADESDGLEVAEEATAVAPVEAEAEYKPLAPGMALSREAAMTAVLPKAGELAPGIAIPMEAAMTAILPKTAAESKAEAVEEPANEEPADVYTALVMVTGTLARQYGIAGGLRHAAAYDRRYFVVDGVGIPWDEITVWQRV